MEYGIRGIPPIRGTPDMGCMGLGPIPHTPLVRCMGDGVKEQQQPQQHMSMLLGLLLFHALVLLLLMYCFTLIHCTMLYSC